MCAHVCVCARACVIVYVCRIKYNHRTEGTETHLQQSGKCVEVRNNIVFFHPIEDFHGALGLDAGLRPDCVEQSLVDEPWVSLRKSAEEGIVCSVIRLDAPGIHGGEGSTNEFDEAIIDGAKTCTRVRSREIM